MSDLKCPLGDDCDLTIAYMLGVENARDTIKALRAEVERLRAALVDLLWYTEAIEPFVYDDEERPKAHASVAAARAAIEGQPAPGEEEA